MFAGFEQGDSGVFHCRVGNLAATRIVPTLGINLQIFAEIYRTQLTFFSFPVAFFVMV
jgi:hypothetical protein